MTRPELEWSAGALLGIRVLRCVLECNGLKRGAKVAEELLEDVPPSIRKVAAEAEANRRAADKRRNR